MPAFSVVPTIAMPVLQPSAKVESAAPAEPPAEERSPIPSDAPELPRTGFAVAVDRAKALLDKARVALRPAPGETSGRPRWLLPVATTGGLVVGVGLVGLLFSLCGRGNGSEAESPRPLSVCTLTGAARVLAPVAVVGAGVEVRSLGDGIALGFAPADHEATALRLDLDSLSTSGSASSRGVESIRRVLPLLASKDGAGLAVDVDAPGDGVRGRRTLPLEPPLQVGAVGSDLVWTRPGGPPVGKLWSFDGSDDPNALRGASETARGDTTTAIAFRHGRTIEVGVATGSKELAARGPLAHIEGLGQAIGSPAVAIEEGVVLVAWADRSSPDAPWRLRVAHMKAGDPPGDPVDFAPPAGGPGGHAMSPGLAAVPGGFLLVWTEGPTSHQRVRGVTLTLAGKPVGKALEISNEAVNSGQAQAAVTASPKVRGVVAFLQATGDGFAIAAAPIGCGP
ncbi:MAG: hypothetical protein L3K06_07215 [Thermoplasmata archaeon]|nr:hypothetical protein [Thermoplasmata archaeon]